MGLVQVIWKGRFFAVRCFFWGGELKRVRGISLKSLFCKSPGAQVKFNTVTCKRFR